MSSSTVKDIFSKGFASVREDDTLSSCFSLFKEEMPPREGENRARMVSTMEITLTKE